MPTFTNTITRAKLITKENECLRKLNEWNANQSQIRKQLMLSYLGKLLIVILMISFLSCRSTYKSRRLHKEYITCPTYH